MLSRIEHWLPVWAQSNHPALRFILGVERQKRWRVFIRQFLMALAIPLMVGILVFQDGGGLLGDSLPARLVVVFLFSGIAAQVVWGIEALEVCAKSIINERRKRTWDHLRTTPDGIAMMLRAYWSMAVFHRSMGFLAFVYTVRVGLLAILLYDLTAFRGDYLDMLTGTSATPIPVWWGAILFVITVTAVFILPLTSIGFDAAVGLIVAAFVRPAIIVSLIHLFLGFFRLVLSIGSVVLLIWIIGTADFHDSQTLWWVIFGAGALGDLGLRHLHGAFLGEVWQVVPYSIYVGVALMGVALLQALMTDGLIRLAVRRARYIE